MRTLVCALLIAVAVWAQKKPITLEALREPPARGQGGRVWAPDGRSFAFRQDGELKIYDAVSPTPKRVTDSEKREATAVKPPDGSGPFEWTNRNARTGGLEWSDDGKSLLDAAPGDLFLFRVRGGGGG